MYIPTEHTRNARMKINALNLHAKEKVELIESDGS